MQRRGGVGLQRRRPQDILYLLFFVVVVYLLIRTRPMRGAVVLQRPASMDEVRPDNEVRAHRVSSSTSDVWEAVPQGRLHYLNGTVFNVAAERPSTKVVIVVNVASHCGFTELNYRELTRMDRELREGQGLPLRILAFPCNQFGGQEPDPPGTIESFVRRNYRSAFDLMEKVDVNQAPGVAVHPLFAELKRRSSVRNIEWNFAKFLITNGGQTVAHFDTRFPFDVFRQEVEGALKKHVV